MCLPTTSQIPLLLYLAQPPSQSSFSFPTFSKDQILDIDNHHLPRLFSIPFCFFLFMMQPFLVYYFTFLFFHKLSHLLFLLFSYTVFSFIYIYIYISLNFCSLYFPKLFLIKAINKTCPLCHEEEDAAASWLAC